MTETMVLENRRVRFEFAAQHFSLCRMRDKQSGVEHLRPGETGPHLWELVYCRR